MQKFKTIIIDGTFITLRINTNKINNIYEYIKRKEINKNEKMED